MSRVAQYPEDTTQADILRRLAILERGPKQSVPVGAVLFTAGAVPHGFLECDGSEKSRAEFPQLDSALAAVGYPYGDGDGTTTFEIPDLRGRFILSKAVSGTGSTLGGAFGTLDHTHTGPSHQHGAAGGHTHAPGGAHGGHGAAGGHIHSSDGSHSGHGSHDHSFSDSFSTSSENKAAQIAQSGGGVTAADDGHTHSGAVAGTTGSAGSSSSAGGHTHDTIGDHSHTTSAGGHTHDTISDHQHGAAGSGATGGGNPPALVLIGIIRT